MQKEQIITQTARGLFFKFGLKKVSIEEIAEQAHISKATFYKYYNNKVDLAESVLEVIFQEDSENFKKILNSDIDFEKQIKQLVQVHEENFEERSEDFYTDIAKYYPVLDSIVNKHKERMFSYINSFLLENQKLGNIRNSLNVAFVSDAIIYLTESAMKGTFESKFKSKKDLLRQVTDLFFYGILNR